jgi:hypothetical protein
MQVELSEAEISLIKEWYLTAVREWEIDSDELCFNLLKKLSIEPSGIHVDVSRNGFFGTRFKP